MQIVITCDSYDELVSVAKQILKDQEKEQTAPTPKKAPAKKAEPKPEPVEDPAEEPMEKTEPDKNRVKMMSAAEVESDVKVMLAGKIKDGKKAEIRALFEEYGVTKLSELTAKYPEKLAEFAKKAEAL